jgi:hypothetical protein
MSPEHMLLHLCLHAAYLDYFSTGIRPFCDIAWTLQTLQDQLDWEKLAIEANAWGARRSLFLSLNLAGKLLRAPLPDGLLEKEEQIDGQATLSTAYGLPNKSEEIFRNLEPDGYNSELETWATDQILHPTSVGPKTADVFAPHSWPRRVVLFFQKLFPPPEEIRHLYPQKAHGARWPLAYLGHLGAIFRRNRRTASQMLRGDPAAAEAVQKRLHVNQLLEWQSGADKNSDAKPEA